MCPDSSPGSGSSGSSSSSPGDGQKLTLEGAVKAFLSLAMVPPEKPPKLVRDQRQNEAIIVGFNRAQETLRDILKLHGAAEDIKRLGETRAEGQREPMRVGDTRVWVTG